MQKQKERKRTGHATEGVGEEGEAMEKQKRIQQIVLFSPWKDRVEGGQKAWQRRWEDIKD